MPRLTQKRVRELFDYNPETGILTWKVFASTRAMPGSKAGSVGNDGYLGVGINKKRYRYHRVIWLWVYGYMPENHVDHINRDILDNRIVNIREVSIQCNMRNKDVSKTNKTGVKGVSFIKKRNEWVANLMINNKTYFLGNYKDFFEAVCARLAGEQCVGWSGCDSSSSAFKYVQRMLNYE